MAFASIYQRKLALIIGINAYQTDSLQYCINDAIDLDSSLKRIGFETSLGKECNLKRFYSKIDKFVENIQNNDLVLFYFAGHGKQCEDENFLLPSDYDYDYKGHENEYIKQHAINTKYIMKKINDKKCSFTIYLFDCCRFLLKTRAINVNTGLSPMIPQIQTLIVFTCAPGKSVLDETHNNRNGGFIENLLKYISIPNMDFEETIKMVALDINIQTHGFQLLYRTSSFTNKVCLFMTNPQEPTVADSTVQAISNGASTNIEKSTSSHEIHMINVTENTSSTATKHSGCTIRRISSDTDIHKKSKTDITKTINQTVDFENEKSEWLRLLFHQFEMTVLTNEFPSYYNRIQDLQQTNDALQRTIDELNDSRKTIDLATVEKAEEEIRVKRAEYDLACYKILIDDINQWIIEDKSKINSLQLKLEENQKEFSHLQHLMENSTSDIENYQNEIKHLYEEISRLLTELDQKTMARIHTEYEKQITFLSAIHEQEMNELRNLSSPCIGIDSTIFYKNELERTIPEIRKQYENLSRSQRTELEEYYRIKTDEIVQQAQNNQLINQENSNQIRININETKKEMFDLQTISKLESKLEALKQEFESNTYRHLLESVEGRIRDAKYTIKTSTRTTTNYRHPSPPPPPHITKTITNEKPINQTEMQVKTTFQRSAKGPINICECSPDGKYIQLANISRNKDIDLTGWRLLRKVDDSPEIIYSLPSGLKLSSGKYLKIYARGQGEDKSPDDLVLSTHDSWGVGYNIVTRLLNEQNEEKATHIQTTWH